MYCYITLFFVFGVKIQLRSTNPKKRKRNNGNPNRKKFTDIVARKKGTEIGAVPGKDIVIAAATGTIIIIIIPRKILTKNLASTEPRPGGIL